MDLSISSGTHDAVSGQVVSGRIPTPKTLKITQRREENGSCVCVCVLLLLIIHHHPVDNSDDNLGGSACNSWHLVSWGWREGNSMEV